jgi:hypothetical protein
MEMGTERNYNCDEMMQVRGEGRSGVGEGGKKAEVLPGYFEHRNDRISCMADWRGREKGRQLPGLLMKAEVPG